MDTAGEPATFVPEPLSPRRARRRGRRRQAARRDQLLGAVRAGRALHVHHVERRVAAGCPQVSMVPARRSVSRRGNGTRKRGRIANLSCPNLAEYIVYPRTKIRFEHHTSVRLEADHGAHRPVVVTPTYYK
uniref:Uncharacterized protein n=1 Tax=Oryza sativa subsp. japonica TaxID=39947 RepID=Q6Z199_ORYSJ|nr:hypothetical protein [Oryza sativa Japonica Group]BAD03593.1 hypothetical protein [Oryza sativa Japonica Group]